MEVPAALWECCGQCATHMWATPAGATSPKTGGRQTQAPAGTNPRTGPFGRYSLQLLFNIAGAVTLALLRTFTVWEVVVRSWVVC